MMPLVHCLIILWEKSVSFPIKKIKLAGWIKVTFSQNLPGVWIISSLTVTAIIINIIIFLSHANAFPWNNLFFPNRGNQVMWWKFLYFHFLRISCSPTVHTKKNSMPSALVKTHLKLPFSRCEIPPIKTRNFGGISETQRCRELY